MRGKKTERDPSREGENERMRLKEITSERQTTGVIERDNI